MLSYRIDTEFLLPADEQGRGEIKKHLTKKHGRDDSQLIARSILSRPIDAYVIGEGERCVLVVGAHHALESITANIAYLLIDLLLTYSHSGVVKGIDCKLLLSKYRFIVIPCVNPDGIELRLHGVGESPLRERQLRMSGGDFSRWQANARGVDLNHNYSVGFSEYKRIEGERGIYPGPSLYSGEYPESEPETKGVANLVRVLTPFAVLSLHSQGEEIYFFPGAPSVGRCAARLSSLTGYKVAEPTDTALYGGLCDFTGAMGIPSFTYEVGKGENPLPENDIVGIFPRIAESIVLLPTLL